MTSVLAGMDGFCFSVAYCHRTCFHGALVDVASILAVSPLLSRCLAMNCTERLNGRMYINVL